ncbi:hypothetical protein ACT0LX_003388 [Vibrio parahaemolyticus]
MKSKHKAEKQSFIYLGSAEEEVIARIILDLAWESPINRKNLKELTGEYEYLTVVKVLGILRESGEVVCKDGYIYLR